MTFLNRHVAMLSVSFWATLVGAGVGTFGNRFCEEFASQARGDDYAANANVDESTDIKKGGADEVGTLSETIQKSPRDSRLYVRRGKIYQRQRNFDRAIQDYSEALTLDPKAADALEERAACHNSKGDYDKAIADCNEALRLSPRRASTYRNRARAYFEKSDLAKAIEDLNRAIEIERSSPDALNDRGICFARLGEFKKAIADFSEAIGLSAGYARAYSNRAFAYLATGDLEKALADCNEAIKIDPGFVDAYRNRFSTYYRIGDPEKAIADASDVVRLSPGDCNAYALRGSALSHFGEHARAAGDLDVAVRLRPKDFYILETRAVVRVRGGNYQGGIDDLHTAVGLDTADQADKFENWPKTTLAPEAVERGAAQVRRMLRDRSVMAKCGAKAQRIYDWAARKFAGEDVGAAILWNPFEPDSSDADNAIRYIRIATNHRQGPDRGKAMSFEESWRCAVFELYNTGNAATFARLDAAVAGGGITKETFVARTIDCESLAAEKTRAFYIHVYLPWAKDNRIPTDPARWYIGSRSNCKEHLLSQWDRDATYGQYYERRFDWIRDLRAYQKAGERARGDADFARPEKPGPRN
jgi:tetratricopeptide (TPR) repeat protein